MKSKWGPLINKMALCFVEGDLPFISPKVRPLIGFQWKRTGLNLGGLGDSSLEHRQIKCEITSQMKEI